jgi:hypothetical protein
LIFRFSMEEPESKPDNKKKLVPIILVLIIIVVIIGAFLLLGDDHQKTPDAAYERYMEKLSDGDWQSATDLTIWKFHEDYEEIVNHPAGWVNFYYFEVHSMTLTYEADMNDTRKALVQDIREVCAGYDVIVDDFCDIDTAVTMYGWDGTQEPYNDTVLFAEIGSKWYLYYSEHWG